MELIFQMKCAEISGFHQNDAKIGIFALQLLLEHLIRAEKSVPQPQDNDDLITKP